MLKKLQAKWKVNGWNLLLIICTFAIGGSICGFVGREVLRLTGLEKNMAWIVIYMLLITVLWPLSVLIVSIPLGQYLFFKKYIRKILARAGLAKKNTATTYRIAIFASGAGSNAKKIIEHFKNNPDIKIGLIVTNRPKAAVLQIAADNNIASVIINKDLPIDSIHFMRQLEKRNINFIVLAGFLLKIPAMLIHAFPRKIINIHPALLPSYGGKGMYGMRVHEAVISNKEKQSGISIHYVDEIYDHGEIIFQAVCDIAATDTAETLAQKIHQLEHAHFPSVIESILKSKNQVK